VQGTFQTFAALADQRYDGTLRGKVVLTAGLGGMGGAQPLAVTMNGGTALCLDVDPSRVQRRIETRYLDEVADSVEDGLRRVRAAAAAGRRCRSAWSPTPPRCCPTCWPAARGRHRHRPDQRARPAQRLRARRAVRRGGGRAAAQQARRVRRAGPRLHGRALPGDGRLLARRREVFDYGNNLRGEAAEAGYADAMEYPGFVPAYIRPLFCEGIGPFRFVALSGDPNDIAVADAALLDAFPDDPYVQRWIPLARERVAFQGLPARICWLGYGDRAKAGALLNDLVASGRISAPVVIGRDHLDSGSVASPYRETEAMLDGSDAIATGRCSTRCSTSRAARPGWPSTTAAASAWASPSTAGRRCWPTGPPTGAQGGAGADQRPGTGVVRHADAGYDIARRVARERGIDMPML
jgi:urocanate hydratase